MANARVGLRIRELAGVSCYNLWESKQWSNTETTMKRTILTVGFLAALTVIVTAQDAAKLAPKEESSDAKSDDAKPETAEGKFKNVAADMGAVIERSGRVYLQDLDSDGFPDLIVQVPDKKGPGNKGGVAEIFMNREGEKGARKFQHIEGLLPAHNGDIDDETRHASVFTVFGDFNNDNVLDAFRPVFQELKGHEKFPDTGERHGVWLGKSSKKTGVKYKYKAGDWAETPAEGTCAVAVLDYNRDGNLDIFLGSWYRQYGKSLDAFPNRLYAGDGKGGFSDVTEAAGLMTKQAAGKADSSRPTYGVSVCDYNGDGWSDLVVANYGRQWNRLWHNNGDGTFKDVAPALGVDGDEIRHGKYPSWVRRRTESPFRANGNTFSIAPTDFDNDGDIDMFCSEITHGWAGASSDLSALLVNQGSEGGFKFKRVVKPFIRKRADKNNWNQGDLMALWGDFDHDGLQDLALASAAYPDNQRLRVYRQTSDHGFEDVTAKWGIDFDICGHLDVDDIDGDGDLDIVAQGGRRHSKMRKANEIAVWQNNVADARWLKITLEGSKSKGCNRMAYGAKVWVTMGETTMLREVCGGAGHQGVCPSRTLHFGCADAKTVTVRVQWPDKKLSESTFEKVATNRAITIKQSGGIQEDD